MIFWLIPVFMFSGLFCNFVPPSRRPEETPKSAQDLPKEDPGAPKELPRSTQELPRSVPELPKSLQGAPKSSQELPRSTPEPPRGPKGIPKTPQDASRGPPKHPKTTASPTSFATLSPRGDSNLHCKKEKSQSSTESRRRSNECSEKAMGLVTATREGQYIYIYI